MGAFKVIIGTQTFTCVNGSFAASSVPEADLAGRGGRIHHFKGPSWQSERDGSTITAAKVAERPRAGTIPELLLQVSSCTGPERGHLAGVTRIQRLHTSGGVALTTACTDGETVAVGYGATYVLRG